MATLQTNPMHEELGSDEETITDLQTGVTGARSGFSGGHSSSRPASLPVMSRDQEEVEPSWTGGLGQGCAPVFQPFGSPSNNITGYPTVV